MTLGEDLLLLAVNRRNGMIQRVERMAPALRALELIELGLAGRITVEQGLIEVRDASPVGHRLVDNALRSLSGDAKPTKVETWLRGKESDHGRPGPYIALLGPQQVIRVEYGGQGLARTTRITVRDQERYARARARIDLVAHGDASATAGDHALAGIVHACGLGRHLYRGPHRFVARRRLARFAIAEEVTQSMRAAVAAADAEVAQAVAEALRLEYRLDTYNFYTYGGGHHHHTPTDLGSHSGHHSGSGDFGGGHHHG